MPYADAERRRAYAREYGQKWYSRHKDRIRTRRRKQFAQSAERRSEHRALVKALWWQKNRTRLLEQKRLYRQLKPWWNRAGYAKRRAIVKGLTSENVDYARVLKAARGLCGICHLSLATEPIHFDHIVPIARGGAHVESNLQATHRTCNLKKGTKVAA